jgi:hypothetical protein
MALPVAGFVYLKTAPLWMLWLGLRLRQHAQKTIMPPQ